MRSLILTVLYLAKDTVHRWFSRISSPLARVLVVFFLSLCALAALGSYAISVKIVRDRIKTQGGDLIYVSMGGEHDAYSTVPTREELRKILGVESYALSSLGVASSGRQRLPVYTYDFRRGGQYLPLMAASGIPTCFIKQSETALSPGPATAVMSGNRFDVFVKRLPDDHPMLRLMGGKGILVQPDNLPPFLGGDRPGMHHIIMRLPELDNSESIARVEGYFTNYMRLDGWAGNIASASRLLAELDGVLDKQVQCRAAFCVGISCIVGILLTALAGMEYRQNEYIYTLMKSFGIHPVMLVGAFVVENAVIVGGAFVAALVAFMRFQVYIVDNVLKLNSSFALTLEEITPEIRLIATTLGVCVLVSSLPIVAAANRAIGRVLK